MKIIHHSEGGKSTNSTQILRRVGREREREGEKWGRRQSKKHLMVDLARSNSIPREVEGLGTHCGLKWKRKEGKRNKGSLEEAANWLPNLNAKHLYYKL